MVMRIMYPALLALVISTAFGSTHHQVMVTGVALKPANPSIVPLLKQRYGATFFLLPEQYTAVLKGTGTPVSYQVVVTDASPLRYDPMRQLFEGGVQFLPVATADLGNPTPAQKPLATTDTMFLTYGNISIPIPISRLNWPPIVVKVTCPDPVDSMPLKILTIGNASGYLKYLKVDPAVFLSSSRSTLQGLGFQTIPLHVALKGVSKYGPVKVALEASLGSLDSGQVTLQDNTPREVTLRSEKWGPVRVQVAGSNFRSNSLDLEATFPWLFLVLALLGGLLGSVTRLLKGRRKFALRPLAFGTLSGLIVSLAYWGVGIMLIAIPFKFPAFNEAAIFVLGVLAGYLELGDLQNLVKAKP